MSDPSFPTCLQTSRSAMSELSVVPQESEVPPKIWGLSLKYVSLIILAVQNATLTIIMHHSRVSTPPSRVYSAASAVLLNELLKGFISLAIAVYNIDRTLPNTCRKTPMNYLLSSSPPSFNVSYTIDKWLYRFKRVGREVFSDDCWKLAIPAILYVIQNNLQYVAAANLDVATFTVTYQMKILTTAAFSVMLLRKKLGSTKWMALFFLAVGVGIVQLQASVGTHGRSFVRNPSQAIMSLNNTIKLGDHEPTLLNGTPPSTHTMNPLKGFLAVTAACFTSGLAGVYFEMVLKGSKADLWIRNVQLSLFSLLPALVPILFSETPVNSGGWFWDLFRNFGVWAWATVTAQVLGGLITAVVIKYSDNIMKGFATSLSIIISFLASVVLFNFTITPAFIFGSTTVLVATYTYNKPCSKSSIYGPDSRPLFPGPPNGSNSLINVMGLSNKKRYGTSPYSASTTPTSYFSKSPSSSPPSSRPPTRPPSAPRTGHGLMDTQDDDGRSNCCDHLMDVSTSAVEQVTKSDIRSTSSFVLTSLTIQTSRSSTPTILSSTFSSFGPTASSVPAVQRDAEPLTSTHFNNTTRIIVGCALGGVIALSALIMVLWFIWSVIPHYNLDRNQIESKLEISRRYKHWKRKNLDETVARWRIMDLGEENIHPKPYEYDLVGPSSSLNFGYSINTTSHSNVLSLGDSTPSLQSQCRSSSDSVDRVAFPSSNSRNTSLPLLQRPVHRPIRITTS
ncbi:hypothetical protein Clacol_006579 [Clathrus columnatus]|uniref:UDP-galactose transporter n=1 Tax=Clathrus columnatus TaxID=1419009 RepID=A0AAV5AGT2_9AGAM|nr:hypothetical protein Clacol_006579 [Clathrus columnatus]